MKTAEKTIAENKADEIKQKIERLVVRKRKERAEKKEAKCEKKPRGRRPKQNLEPELYPHCHECILFKYKAEALDNHMAQCHLLEVPRKQKQPHQEPQALPEPQPHQEPHSTGECDPQQTTKAAVVYRCAICVRFGRLKRGRLEEFAVRNSAARHMRTHSNYKPEQCSVCLWNFPNRWNLNRHVRTVHRDLHESPENAATTDAPQLTMMTAPNDERPPQLPPSYPPPHHQIPPMRLLNHLHRGHFPSVGSTAAFTAPFDQRNAVVPRFQARPIRPADMYALPVAVDDASHDGAALRQTNQEPRQEPAQQQSRGLPMSHVANRTDRFHAKNEQQNLIQPFQRIPNRMNGLPVNDRQQNALHSFNDCCNHANTPSSLRLKCSVERHSREYSRQLRQEHCMGSLGPPLFPLPFPPLMHPMVSLHLQHIQQNNQLLHWYRHVYNPCMEPHAVSNSPHMEPRDTAQDDRDDVMRRAEEPVNVSVNVQHRNLVEDVHEEAMSHDVKRDLKEDVIMDQRETKKNVNVHQIETEEDRNEEAMNVGVNVNQRETEEDGNVYQIAPAVDINAQTGSAVFVEPLNLVIHHRVDPRMTPG